MSPRVEVRKDLGVCLDKGRGLGRPCCLLLWTVSAGVKNDPEDGKCEKDREGMEVWVVKTTTCTQRVSVRGQKTSQRYSSDDTWSFGIVT